MLYATGLLIVLQLLLTYWPPLQHLFSTTALSADDWGRIIVITSSVLFIVELEKWVVRHWLARTLAGRPVR